MPPSNPEVTVVELAASITDFASAAGLAPTASKSDVLVKITKDRESASTAAAETTAAKTETSKLLEAIGAKSVEEAVGKLSGERASHLSLVRAVVNDPKNENATTKDALEKLGAERKAQDLIGAKALIAQAQADGKTAGEGAMKMFEEFGMTGLKAHLDALVPHTALVGKAPDQRAPKAGGEKSENGGPVVVLTPADEKMIKDYKLDREGFIETRRQQLAEKADAQG